MRIAVLASNSFIGKNLIENLKNIRDGKNRTRPDLSISDINEDKVEDADMVIILPGAEIEQKIEGDVIYIASFIPSEDEVKVIDTLPEEALIYRLPEIIGKWEKPDEGVIAGLCYAVANDEEYEVSNHDDMLEILFIDDFVTEILDALEGHPHRCNFPAAGEPSSDPTAQYDGKTPVPDTNWKYCYSPQIIRTTVESVIKLLESFNQMNTTLIVPEMPADSLAYKLFSMYLSYLPERKMSYPVKMSMDNRGVFTELVKTRNNGQVSINIARPNNVRGQHWHNNKW